MAEAWIITGVPGAGKSTIARSLGSHFDRSVHIEGDLLLHEWIVKGYVPPDGEPREEADRQVRLSIKNQCLLAHSFSEGGFVPIMDSVVPNQPDLNAFRAHLRGFDLHLIILAPDPLIAIQRDLERPGKTVSDRWNPVQMEPEFRRELPGIGLWVDSSNLSVDETVDYVLQHKADARV